MSRGRGYMHTTLFVGGERVDVRVHRIVATAFIPNPDERPDKPYCPLKNPGRKNCLPSHQKYSPSKTAPKWKSK